MMPDILMYANKDCPLASKCYRFCATPGERQAYGDFRPLITAAGPICGYFMPLSWWHTAAEGGKEVEE